MHLLPLLVALATPAEAAAPLEITITDSQVVAVVLECGGDTKRAIVRDGLASFPETPKTACQVNFVRKSGVVDSPGKWTCGLEGCSQQDVHHRAVSNAPGRVNIITTSAASQLEVTCPGGYRERASVVENTATFEGVPNESCMLLFKGGTPARFNGLRAGATYQCNLTGTAAVCTQR